MGGAPSTQPRKDEMKSAQQSVDAILRWTLCIVCFRFVFIVSVDDARTVPKVILFLFAGAATQIDADVSRLKHKRDMGVAV